MHLSSMLRRAFTNHELMFTLFVIVGILFALALVAVAILARLTH